MNPDRRQESALDWIVRTGDPEFDGWDKFTDWLEADPANADAYHRLADSEAILRPMVGAAAIANQPLHAERTRGSRPRLAIAASVALLAAAAVTLVGQRFMPVTYSTGPGELKTVPLGAGDQLVMNGDTNLSLGGFDRRDIRLDQGQVFLRLAGSSNERIDLRSGDLRLVDVGTKFEVSRDGSSTRVVVSEGVVVADPNGAHLRLSAGQKLETKDGATLLQAQAADPQSAGGFERGQLVYSDEPLTQVVADLRRSTGIDFSANEAIKTRRFSGTLSVAEVKRDPGSLGPLLGVAMRKSRQGWTLGVSE